MGGILAGLDVGFFELVVGDHGIEVLVVPGGGRRDAVVDCVVRGVHPEEGDEDPLVWEDGKGWVRVALCVHVEGCSWCMLVSGCWMDVE